MITKELPEETHHPRARKPGWLKVRAPGGEAYARIKRLLRERKLHTVCEEAQCPNQGECWGAGTATVLILGDVCTRGCRFCAVTSGNPGGEVDPEEPWKVSEVIASLGLRYVVLTSVDRDDLPDGGADHFAETIRQIHAQDREIRVEVLTPDFQGDRQAVGTVLQGGPDVFAHNLEVVRRLTPVIRDRRCDYDQSLDVLLTAKAIHPEGMTKSSIMLGLGETEEEVLQAMDDLVGVGVDVLTLGQYLQPSPKHHEVVEFIHPDRFEELGRKAKSMGFLYVASGPLVRSSYRAAELFLEGEIGR
jgi:lipoic acid synthetase